MRFFLTLLTFFGASAISQASEPHPGEKPFQMNCMACHQVQTGLVGPSLVEISKLYPLKNQKDFLEWSKNPQQKRQGAIEMPSMAHLGDDVLSSIQEYMLLKAEGKKEIKPKPTDPFKDSPAYTKFPRTERLYIEESGPASIAILPAADFGAVWDAGQGRLRYISKSRFDSWPDWEKGGRGQGKFLGTIDYRELEPHLLSIAKDTELDFKGYRLKEGLPTFIYNYGPVSVTEAYGYNSEAGTLTRSFNLEGLSDALTLALKHEGQAEVTLESAGEQIPLSEDSSAILSPEQAAAFSITVRP